MSYFSDASSTCSAPPPLTPSSHHASSSSSSHSHSHSDSYSSPAPYTPESAPRTDPLKQYSSALKMRMSAGLTAAMKDLRDDRGGPERRFDAEYGYDEDPIERHVRLFLTPRKVPEKKSKAVPELGLGIRPASSYDAPPMNPIIPLPPPPATTTVINRPVSKMVQAAAMEKVIPSVHRRHHEEDMLAPPTPDEQALLDQDPLPAKFQPGLIHFHRTNSSSLDPPRPPFSRLDSDISTSSSSFSSISEASFEAVRAEDIVSMYASALPKSGAGKAYEAEDPFGLELVEEEMGRASMDSQDTYATIRAAKSYQVGAIPATASLISQQSQTQTQTQTQPLKVYSQPTQALPQVQVHSQAPTPPHFPTRPSFTRKRSRVHPYESAQLNPPHERRTPGPGAGAGAGAVTPDDAGEPAWLANRTVSEHMVAMAGLRSQRQRVGATRAPAR